MFNYAIYQPLFHFDMRFDPFYWWMIGGCIAVIAATMSSDASPQRSLNFWF
jgi:hypothetical protein